jgi:protein SCO1/2
MILRRSLLALIALIAIIAPVGALAQGGTTQPGAKPDPLKDVSYDQRLNAQLPLDLPFVDEQGRSVTLGAYFGKQPVVLQLSYYECPMLCPLVRSGMLSALKDVSLAAGKDFQIVNVSIDPQETPMMAANAKASALATYNRPGAEAGMHFLTGSQDSVDRLAEAIGFHYVYDETIDQYAHAAGIIALTPEGRVARYFYGIEYNPSDVRLGLVEASRNTIGSPVDQLLLLCYHYDPVTGTYTGMVMTAVRVGGVLIVLIMAAAIALFSRGAGRPGSPRGPAPQAG